MSTVEKYVAERNAAFEADDFEWARRQAMAETGTDVSPTVYVMAFHMARSRCEHVSAEKRQASKAWLANRNIKKGE